MTSQIAGMNSASGGERAEYGLAAKVSAAHFTSHVYYLVLPPLFPLLKDQLHVGYVELGLAMTLFNVITAVLQAPMGFAVDRFDARSILVAGSMPRRLRLSRLCGTPDLSLPDGDGRARRHRQRRLPSRRYAILSSAVTPSRMGRVFSCHLFAGYLGSGVAPAAMLGLTALAGFRVAVAAAGCLALVVAVPLVLDILERSAVARKAASPVKGQRSDAGNPCSYPGSAVAHRLLRADQPFVDRNLQFYRRGASGEARGCRSERRMARRRRSCSPPPWVSLPGA